MLKLGVGDEVAVREADVVRLCEAFFAKVEEVSRSLSAEPPSLAALPPAP